MPRGGARKGAGRKRGIPNVRKRAEIVKDLVERGEDPLQYFLSIMKDTERSDGAARLGGGTGCTVCAIRGSSRSTRRTTFKGDPLAEVMEAIDGRTTGISPAHRSEGEPPHGDCQTCTASLTRTAARSRSVRIGRKRALLDDLHNQNLILKARQLGFTTFIQIFMLDACIFNSNIRAGTIAHRLDDAKVIFRDKIRFPYDNLPDWLKANCGHRKGRGR